MKSPEESNITTAGHQPGGYVYIIGAGPGDPELLTVKADRVLREADVILYDDLVCSELMARFTALKIFTGKRKDCHHFEQEAINEEILRHARAGKIVARLKGGDPFIFGRGGEEIEVLRQNGIGYEIIPGITAAHGASAYTEIPLTMRKVSSSVAFCTGHPVSKIQVPDADTLVYYMVASTVHEVLDAVAQKGRDEHTPVAIVQNATRYNQSTLFSTLGELRRSEKAVYSPALLMIGETIGLCVEESWFSKKKKVLIAGSDSEVYKRGEFIKVQFFCQKGSVSDLERMENSEPLDLDYIDEIYFSSPLCVRNFQPFHTTIPERIVVKVADEGTRAEYGKLFGGDAAIITH